MTKEQLIREFYEFLRKYKTYDTYMDLLRDYIPDSISPYQWLKNHIHTEWIDSMFTKHFEKYDNSVNEKCDHDWTDISIMWDNIITKFDLKTLEKMPEYFSNSNPYLEAI